MRQDIVNVLCVITPDGRVSYAHNEQGAHAIISNWTANLSPDQRAKHEASGTCGGFVHLFMLAEDYAALSREHRIL